jgi:hypothetical protein
MLDLEQPSFGGFMRKNVSPSVTRLANYTQTLKTFV